MAGSKTGTPTVIKLARKICRVVATFGVSDLTARTTPQFKLAVDGLVLACHAFELLDDHPAEVDETLPQGPEDVIP